MIDDNLLMIFFTLDPLVYFHAFHIFSLSSFKNIHISLAISVLADDLLYLQDSFPGDTHIYLSTNDSDPPNRGRS